MQLQSTNSLPVFNKTICSDFYAKVVNRLLEQHYGVSIDDTNMSDDFVISQAIDDDTLPYELINEWAEECGAERMSVNHYLGTSTNLTLNDQQKIIDELKN